MDPTFKFCVPYPVDISQSWETSSTALSGYAILQYKILNEDIIPSTDTFIINYRIVIQCSQDCDDFLKREWELVCNLSPILSTMLSVMHLRELEPWLLDTVRLMALSSSSVPETPSSGSLPCTPYPKREVAFIYPHPDKSQWTVMELSDLSIFSLQRTSGVDGRYAYRIVLCMTKSYVVFASDETSLSREWRWVTESVIPLLGRLLSVYDTDALEPVVVKYFTLKAGSQDRDSDLVWVVYAAIESSPSYLSTDISLWTVDMVGEWLDALGLGVYRDSMRRLALDGSLLKDLTDDELTSDVGMTSSIHRHKILAAIQRFSSSNNVSIPMIVIHANGVRRPPARMTLPSSWLSFQQACLTSIKEWGLCQSSVRSSDGIRVFDVLGTEHLNIDTIRDGDNLFVSLGEHMSNETVVPYTPSRLDRLRVSVTSPPMTPVTSSPYTV